MGQAQSQSGGTDCEECPTGVIGPDGRRVGPGGTIIGAGPGAARPGALVPGTHIPQQIHGVLFYIHRKSRRKNLFQRDSFEEVVSSKKNLEMHGHPLHVSSF